MTAQPDPFDMLRDHITAQVESVNRRIDDRHDEVMRLFGAHDELLHGNGQPGLIKLVDRHEQRLNAERQDAAKHGAKWGGMVSTIIAVAAVVIKPIADLLGLKVGQ